MLDEIFKNAPPGTFIEVTRLSPINRNYVPATLPLPDFSSAFGAQPDVYYGPALRRSPGPEKSDVAGTWVLWADIDPKEGKVPAPAPRATLVPSFIVFTGGGWHYYWLLDKFETNSDKIEHANQILMNDTEADSCWNVNRLLRVPGTINSKYGAYCELRRKYDHVYRIEDFNVISGLNDKTRHKIRTGDSRGYKSDSERDWAVIEALVANEATDDLINQIFQTQPVGDKVRKPETGADYLQHTIDNARAAVARRGSKFKVGGIFEKEDGYYIHGRQGLRRLSTFVFKPELLLQGSEDAFVGDISASGYTWKDVTFTRSAFNDRRSLDKQLPVSAWSWLGRDDDVRFLLPYILGQLQDRGLPKALSTNVLGRHGKFFVTNGLTVSEDQVFKGKERPVVYLPTRAEVPKLHLTEGDSPDLSTLPELNTPEAIWPIIGWFMATPYKPLLEERGVRFPVLNVYGTRGSGKTTLIKTMLRLMGYATPITYDCKTTRFVTLTLLGSTNAVPVAFSEYRQSAAEQFLRFVLLSYDSGHDPRGRSDQSTVDYVLSAPFCVDGEDIINDAAARERMVAVLLHPETIAEGSTPYFAFDRVAGLPLERFARGYIQDTLSMNMDDLLAEATLQIHEAFPETLPDRVRNNMIVTRVGQISFSQTTGVELDVPVRKAFETILRSVWSPELGRAPALVDEFVETVVNAVSRGRADFAYKVEGSVLWFQLSTAFQWWLRSRRMGGQSSLDRDAIRNQLLERDVERGEAGQYTLKPKAIGKGWYYGIDLDKALAAGLDINAELSSRELTVNF